jgi:hypothetical protein
MDHAQILSKLINGVLNREERAQVLRWCTQFADTYITNQAQHLLHKFRTAKCSVCAFINRCGVIQPGLGNKVQTLDSTLHAAGVHLPVNWTVVCILGGILMDIYTYSVDMDFDIWYLQPGDIVHHYMLSSKCLYDRIGPMMALREVCSLLAENEPIDTEEEDSDPMEAADDPCDPGDITFGVQVEDRKSPDAQKAAQSAVSRLLSMVKGSDASPGTCENMTYIPVGDKARAFAMHIPSSVMLRDTICDQAPSQSRASAEPRRRLSEERDDLYDIYRDLAMYDERDSDSGEGTRPEEGPIDREPEKVRTLKLETYLWMRGLANTALL